MFSPYHLLDQDWAGAGVLPVRDSYLAHRPGLPGYTGVGGVVGHAHRLPKLGLDSVALDIPGGDAVLPPLCAGALFGRAGRFGQLSQRALL